MLNTAVQPVSTTEAVAAVMRESILDGVIEPGTRLPSELVLAAEYGVARPTVREAIQALCHEGLLKRERNRTPVVPRLTSEDVVDLFSVRIPLEVMILRRAMACAPSLDPAREAIARFERLPADAGWSRVVEADLTFHQALAQASGSPRLERLYGSLTGEIRLCVAQSRHAWPTTAAIAAEHQAVIEVIDSGSVSDAVDRLTEHLQEGLAALLAGLGPDT